MTLTPTRRLLLVAACLPLLLVACTDAPGPSSSSGSSTSPAPTSTSTVRAASTNASSALPTASPSAPRSAPAPKAGVVVAAAGDIACDPNHEAFAGGRGTPTDCQQLATSDLVLAMKPAKVLVLGDIQYEVGRLEDFKKSYDKSWGRFKDKTVPAPGNHEYGTGVTRGYFEYFGPKVGTKKKSWYSTDVGGWHVISLNSNCAQIGGCQVGSAQEKWLRADLAANKAKCTLAIWHHPRWTSGLRGNFSQVDGLWRTLAEAGADVVLAGHDHHYERFAPLNADGQVDPAKGIRSFVVGTGGRNLYPAFGRATGSEVRDSQTFGVLKLTLSPASYTWEFVAVPGESFSDTGSGSCH